MLRKSKVFHSINKIETIAKTELDTTHHNHDSYLVNEFRIYFMHCLVLQPKENLQNIMESTSDYTNQCTTKFHLNIICGTQKEQSLF